MSDSGWTQIPNSILRDRTMTVGARVLYGVILSYSWTVGGECRRSAKDLADQCGIGRTAFFEAVTQLRERGLLRIEKRKSRNGWANVYIPVATGVEVTGDDGVEPDEEVVRDADNPGGRPPDEQGVVRQADGGSSARRTQNKTPGEEDASADALAARADKNGQGAMALEAPTRPSMTFNRRKVTAEEWRTVEAIIPIFNEVFGTKFDRWNKTAVSRIVGVLRSFPEASTMPVEEHRQIMLRNAAAPWWSDGKPDTVGVIYSTGAWSRASRCDGVLRGRQAKQSQRATTLAVLDAMERGEGQL